MMSVTPCSLFRSWCYLCLPLSASRLPVSASVCLYRGRQRQAKLPLEFLCLPCVPMSPCFCRSCLASVGSGLPLLALPGLCLPCPSLSVLPGLCLLCPSLSALSGLCLPCPVSVGPARSLSALPGLCRPCTASVGPALPLSALSGLCQPCPVSVCPALPSSYSAGQG